MDFGNTLEGYLIELMENIVSLPNSGEKICDFLFLN